MNTTNHPYHNFVPFRCYLPQTTDPEKAKQAATDLYSILQHAEERGFWKNLFYRPTCLIHFLVYATAESVETYLLIDNSITQLTKSMAKEQGTMLLQPVETLPIYGTYEKTMSVSTRKKSFYSLKIPENLIEKVITKLQLPKGSKGRVLVDFSFFDTN